MSTTTASPTPEPVTLDISATPQTPFSRLMKVEWRKMIDTRSGFWLLAITGGLLVLTVALVVLVVGLNDGQVSAADLSQIMTIPVSLLLPVFAILIVTSEWSQRTALATLTLEPHRIRVIGAKLAAVSIFAVATIVVAVAMGALTNVLCAVVTGNDMEWNLDPAQLFWIAVLQLLYFWMAFALGLLLLNTPGAIAIYYVVSLLLPLMVWGTLYAIFDWAKDVLPWVDLGFAMAPLTSGADPIGEEVSVELVNYAQTAFTAFIWVIVPVSLGIWRLLRAEMK
jgi:ABC-2 type transport system permease protein